LIYNQQQRKIKIEGRINPALYLNLISFYLLFRFYEAIAAINRLVSSGLKRYLGILPALRASGSIHLARASAESAFRTRTLCFPSLTARRATLRLIGKAFAGIKLLFFGREGEGFSAIGTLQGFLFVSHRMTSSIFLWFNLVIQ
jgi:hypothetical protein